MNIFKFLVINMLAFWSFFSVGGPSEEQSLKVKDRIENSIFQVIVLREDGRTSSGTAFAVHEKGFLMTCKHVVESGKKFAVLIDGKYIPARVYAEGEGDLDLALLHVDLEFSSVLKFTNKLTTGEYLWIYGFPGNREGPSMNWGTVKDVSLGPVGIERFYGRAVLPMFFGHSGSPIVNENGDVVGIASRVTIGANNMHKDMYKDAFFVNARGVREFMKFVEKEEQKEKEDALSR